MALAGAASASAYVPITPTDANQTYTLNGHNLTVSKLVAIARYGAKVQLSTYGSRTSLQGVQDTRSFTQDAWYQAPVTLWAPKADEFTPTLKKGVPIWNEAVKSHGKTAPATSG